MLFCLKSYSFTMPTDVFLTAPHPACGVVCGFTRTRSPSTHLQSRHYLYFCTSKASKLISKNLAGIVSHVLLELLRFVFSRTLWQTRCSRHCCRPSLWSSEGTRAVEIGGLPHTTRHSLPELLRLLSLCLLKSAAFVLPWAHPVPHKWP